MILSTILLLYLYPIPVFINALRFRFEGFKIHELDPPQIALVIVPALNFAYMHMAILEYIIEVTYNSIQYIKKKL